MSQPTTASPAPAPDALELRDSRTGSVYAAPIRTEGPEGDTYIRAADLNQVKREACEFGTLSYDPAFMNTASCRSAITYIDGDKGILRYRGYPIEQLAENATFLEVAYLLRHGYLPDQKQYDTWVHDITFHTYVHENIRKFLEGFRYDAHPMNMLCSATAALSSFYPQARDIHDP
ncbi:MAG: citrate/2-methylcitrate synthase, partial [Gemmatimonadaceae bacterium]